jgi:hypothetical protein
MNGQIDNLEIVSTRLEGFIDSLTRRSEDKILELLGMYAPDFEFKIFFYRAKYDIKNLTINDKDTVLRSYYDKMKHSFEKFEKWEIEKSNEQSYATQISIELIEFRIVFDELRSILNIKDFIPENTNCKSFLYEYPTLLYKYLKEEKNKEEKDFIDQCLLELNQKVKEYNSFIEEPYTGFANIQNYKYAEPSTLKKVKNTYKYWINEYNSIIDFLELKVNNENPPPSEPTKAEILKPKLLEYKFNELEKVTKLTNESRTDLIKKLAENGLPYQIAMLDYLGFLDYLHKSHFKTKYKLRAELVKILDATDRSIKGNISVLKDYSKENRTKYTAHSHKENVIKDYEQLI